MKPTTEQNCGHLIVESGRFGTRCGVCGQPVRNVLLEHLLGDRVDPGVPDPDPDPHHPVVDDIFTRATRDLSQ